MSKPAKEGAKKKICFIATIPKAVEWFMLASAKKFSERGWDVCIICDESEDFRRIVPEGVRYLPVRMSRGISLSGIGSMLSMMKIFLKERFDVIQYATPNASLYASLAGMLCGIETRLYRQWGMVFVGFEGKKRSIFKLMEKFICEISTFVAPDSFGNLAFGREQGFYGEEKSGVIANGSSAGIDLTRFDIAKKDEFRKEIRESKGVGEKDFVVGFLGRINGDKGINELLTAFKAFSENKDDVKLMLTGMTDRLEEIKPELWEYAQNDPKVILSGLTTEAEKYYAAMDVYTLPSYREGMPCAVLEAGAMGVATVVTDINGSLEAVIPGKTGLVVPPKDAEALREALETLYAEPVIRNALGARGHEFVAEKFDSVMHFEKTYDFIEKLYSEGKNV